MSDIVEFDFQPIANGMDFLRSAIEQLRDDDNPSNLKYSVLHLQAAVEVLLKTRLVREHWALVFADPSLANAVSFRSGDFGSVTVEETLKRLKGVASIEIGKDGRERLKRLVKIRNRLQHFGTVLNRYEVISVAAGALDTLLAFVVEHVVPGARHEERTELEAVQNLLSESLNEIDALGKARRQRLKGELSSFAGEVTTCPRCTEVALRLNQGSIRCYYCEHNWRSTDASQMAEEYASEVLGISSYDVSRDGADSVIYACVECELDAMVAGVQFLEDSDGYFYACFGCCTIVESVSVGICSRCGVGTYTRTPIDKIEDEGEIDICASCWDNILAES